MRRRDDPPLDDRLRRIAHRGEPSDALGDLDVDDDAICVRLFKAVGRLSAVEAQLVIPLLPPALVDAYLTGAHLLGRLDEERCERLLDKIHPERAALRRFIGHLADPAAEPPLPAAPVRTDPIAHPVTHRRPHSRREALRLVPRG